MGEKFTGEKPYSKTVNALSDAEFNLLLSFISKRDMSQKTRDALIIRRERGYSIGMASHKAGVSRQYVSAAENKLIDMHEKIMNSYGLY